ncbi:hypothetical protein O988_02672 [Pseudogymnoascus sp. VKM F-3808]|nr:hypothetical protein O988_02672 [Pseudogymnoascus sp. VKM F-3808]
MDLQPRIDSMPVEVIEEILSQLALPDICSLRLAGRKLNAKSSQGIFKSYFRNKTIMMGASEQLRQAVHITQRQGLGCLLEHLTLVGLKRPDNDEESSKEAAVLILLRQFMENLGLNVAGGCLQSMYLTINKKDDRFRESNWETAAKCFKHTMLALHANQLPIKSLDVFFWC